VGIQVCSNHGPRGWDTCRASIGKSIFTCLHTKNILNIFSISTWPEKLKFTSKLPDSKQKIICSNHGSLGSDGVTIGETVFTCVYIGKIFLKVIGNIFWHRVYYLDIHVDGLVSKSVIYYAFLKFKWSKHKENWV
jgi:hypothetical protein